MNISTSSRRILTSSSSQGDYSIPSTVCLSLSTCPETRSSEQQHATHAAQQPDAQNTKRNYSKQTALLLLLLLAAPAAVDERTNASHDLLRAQCPREKGNQLNSYLYIHPSLTSAFTLVACDFIINPRRLLRRLDADAVVTAAAAVAVVACVLETTWPEKPCPAPRPEIFEGTDTKAWAEGQPPPAAAMATTARIDFMMERWLDLSRLVQRSDVLLNFLSLRA